MGKIDRPIVPRPRRAFPWTQVLLGAIVVLLAWIGYEQRSTRQSPPVAAQTVQPRVISVEKPKQPETRPPGATANSSPATTPAPVFVEHSATQDVPIRTESSVPLEAAIVQPKPPPPPKQETPKDVAERCLEFSGSIVTTDPIYRPTSVIVEMSALNRCVDTFVGEQVWATATVTGETSGVLGSDFNHFSGTIGSYGKATARVDVACDPNLVRGVVVQLRHYSP
jgi:hypothetical protein